MNNNGYFVVADLEDPLRERIAGLLRRFDPRLAASAPPHVTITGSSGVGPISPGTPIHEIRAALAPIVAGIPPMDLACGAPMRFMQSSVVVLPLDPHGPLRALHEQIAQSGLRFARARFTFTPHVTLSFYPVLTRETERALMSVRVTDPVSIAKVAVYRSIRPMPYERVLELVLGGGVPAGAEDRK